MKWNKLWFGVILVLPVLLIGTSLASFHTPPGSPFSDLAISHYPNAYFLQQTILKDHVIPLWNPNILGGYPFAADPLSGLWYPPGWLSLFFPLPLGINLVILLHILAGGYGFYRFLNECGYPQQISLIGMLCFVLMPKIYAHFGAGHVTLIYAFCITPWLLWSESLDGRKQVVVQSILMTGVILADIRWFPYVLMVWIVNRILQKVTIKGKKFSYLQVITTIGFGLGMSAVFLLPFLQFVSLSTRSGMTSADTLFLSLPPAHLLGLLIPIKASSPEWVIYLGASVIFFVLVGIIRGKKDWGWTWSIVAAISLIWALGSSIPGMQYIAQIPGISSLRVPPRIMFLGDLALILLCLEGLNSFRTNSVGEHKRAIRLVGFGFIVLVTIFSIALFLLSGKANWILLVSPIILLISFVLVLNFKENVTNQTRMMISIGLIIGLDLLTASISQFEVLVRSNDDSISPEVIQIITDNLQGGRIYSPSYSIPQDQAIERGWRLANGVHPLQLANYVSVLKAASGVPNTGYNVVQPPLVNGNPFEDNRFAIPDPNWLARLNVSLVVASYPINSDQFDLLYQNQNIWIYRNPEFLLLPHMERGEANSIEVIRENPNSVEYQVSTNGGTLITDWIDYPGWVIMDNGKEVKAKSDQAFYSLHLEPGDHLIQLFFRPTMMYIGIIITAITIFALFLYSRFPRWPKQIS